MINLDRNALVWGVVGNLGGGKTLSAVAFGVSCMLKGYFVVSNITFNVDRIVSYYGHEWLRDLYQHVSLDDPNFDPFKLPCGSPRGSGGDKRVIIILDEVAEWFDQYASAKDPLISRIWSWLRHTSKRSQDVVIICQRREYIHKVVRSLIARWIWVDDLAVWRIPTLRFRMPFLRNKIMQNVFDRNGSRIGSVSFLGKSHYGQFYDTAECLNSTGAEYNSIYDLKLNYTVSQSTIYFYFTSILILFKMILFN